MNKQTTGATISKEEAPEEKGAEVIPHGHGNQIAKADANQSLFTQVDLSNDPFPTETETERIPLDIGIEYWSPEGAGEAKVAVVFSHISPAMWPDKFGPTKGANGEMKELDTAFFYEKKADGTISMFANCSKGLLSTLIRQAIPVGTLLDVVFRGKETFSNGNTGATWAVFARKFLQKKEQPKN